MAQQTLALLAGQFAVCRLEREAALPEWALRGWFCIARTHDELSIVCPQAHVPEGIACVGGWRCLQVRGPLDWAMTGVLASLATPLAEAGISLFAISTYEMDYILVRQAELEKALAALARAGHRIAERG